jgi:methylglyoxal synthase
MAVLEAQSDRAATDFDLKLHATGFTRKNQSFVSCLEVRGLCSGPFGKLPRR